MHSISTSFFIVAAVYFCGIAVISFLGMRSIRTEDEFLTAGRTIGPWTGGAVLAATQISAGTMVGTVGRHYMTGVSWVWVWPGVWAGWLISAIFVGPKLREFGTVTVPDFLAVRFRSEWARILSAIFIISVYTIMLIAQYQACGVVFESIFGIRPIVAMLILMVSTFLYTALGGVRSSSYIDFLQILIVVTGLVLAVPSLISDVGSLSAMGKFLTTIDHRITGSWYSGAQIFGFSLSFGLSIAAAPYEIVRFSSMRDKATVRKAIGVCFLFQAIIGSCVLIMGLATRALFPSIQNPDQASSMMVLTVLPPFVGSLFLVALLSAIMSNVNAILLVASSGISYDIYGKYLRPMSSEKSKLLVSRLSIVLLSAVPIIFALQRYSDVQSLVVLQTRFIASFFFVPVILGLNTKRGTSSSIVGAMLGGMIGCLFWSIYSSHHKTPIDASEIGILASALAFFIVDKWTHAGPGTPIQGSLS